MKPVVVVDASVAIKWFVSESPDDGDTEEALDLLRAYRDDRLEFYQPPIWRAEVLAVLSRIVPDKVEQHTWKLLAFDYNEASGSALYLRAVQLSIQLGHHLFDTIYHASALSHPSATLITADEKFRIKAESLGRVLSLKRWREIYS
ncbi:MAG: type II toxin-antitoxin system VapC family toxin [Steroidobacteraceae bacterium]|nr:type II toxin-antitoxin system VapC family toxin [Deltaproteobacteria bacterium]